MKSILLACLAACAFGSVAQAQLSISFEELGAQPMWFGSTGPLRNQISGATFAGPGPLDGGAIINQAGNFGVNARSGQHFLAFNRVPQATMNNGGRPIDPEQITFAQAWSDVSIWAAGGWNSDTFTLRAFDASNAQVGSAQVVTQGWAELRVQAPGIVRIELTQSGDDDWLYDDLSASGSSAPSVYCTAGTSTNGCVPAISATGIPSVSASSGFTIQVASVEGQKSGLLFYGVGGRLALSWATGSTSFLCVKTPTQRTTLQSSGGANGLCNGAFSLDALAWATANPAALGQPFSAGDVINAQAWYRDPLAVKTTNLSNALEFTLVP